MSPGKADRLRQRMNRGPAIDPDAPAPTLAPVPVPPPVPKPDPVPAEPSPAAEETSAAPDPQPEPEPAKPATVRRPAARRATRRPGNAVAAAAPDLSWKGKTALEDPDCIPGRRYYRSQYVHDEVYFRFRAAIFWASRNPEAIGEVPQNMTAAVEAFMDELATDLEQRYNGGDVFPMPPPDRRRKGKEGP
ncbi:hypothetical protein [Pseudonocardia alni]|uniref:hypothetical protein n=1 Tax=Pseudonocardia alni TaxID=33907 RepID=UPI0033C520D2